jgi:hypothetical protein
VFPPERIVCLTEDTVETLYLLGEQDRIVGISGCCVRLKPGGKSRASRPSRQPISRRSST